MYTWARQAGFTHERIDIQGWSPGPSEKFLVVAPLNGVDVVTPFELAGVLFTNECPADVGFAPPELAVEFSTATAWLAITVEEHLLMDAETKALEEFRLAIALLRSFADYRYPVLNDVLVPFDSRRTMARPTFSDLVFVSSVASKRAWLRNVEDVPLVGRLDANQLLAQRPTEIILNNMPAGRRIARAFREWQIAADAESDLDRVGPLWRSIECYTHGVSADALFEDDDIQRLVQLANESDSWSYDQRKRIKDVLGRLNDAPLLERLKAAIKLDGVSLCDPELAALAGTRRLRNRLEHGSDPGGTEHQQLDVALGITNKILLTALLNIQREAMLRENGAESFLR